jgi:hypothetical protein
MWSLKNEENKLRITVIPEDVPEHKDRDNGERQKRENLSKLIKAFSLVSRANSTPSKSYQ